MEIVVPDLGDFADVEVIECLASSGDELAAEAPLITIETDKAAMDIPSPVAGRLVELKVAVGDRVSAGDVIAVLDPAEAGNTTNSDDTDVEQAESTCDAVQMQRRS